MSPLEFMQRLAALVPAPAENASGQSADHAHAQPSPARMSWARLLKRVFDIDLVPVKGTMPPSKIPR